LAIKHHGAEPLTEAQAWHIADAILSNRLRGVTLDSHDKIIIDQWRERYRVLAELYREDVASLKADIQRLEQELNDGRT
jgi:hypothetical protein